MSDIYLCSVCGEEAPSYLYIESECDDWTCVECIYSSHARCEICNESLGLTSIDRANSILGNEWMEMCEHCAVEFKSNVRSLDRIHRFK